MNDEFRIHRSIKSPKGSISDAMADLLVAQQTAAAPLTHTESPCVKIQLLANQMNDEFII